MEDVQFYGVVGPSRSRRGGSTAEQVVMEVNTYDQLEQHVASFLASDDHKLLRTCVEQGTGWWGVGVPSAVRRAVEAVDPVRRARWGKVLWVKLPYERWRGWTLRTVQRRLAEGVLGVDAARELVDGADEDDDYSGIEPGGREVVGYVSRRVAEELSRIGSFLLVIENWWEAYSADLETLGIPPPSRWPPRGSKVILWDSMFTGERTPLGEPAANAWLLLHRPTATYVHREVVDVANVLNGRAATITPQDVIDCLLFTSLTVLTEGEITSHPLCQSKSELVQFWVHNGLLMMNGSAAEALVEELLHRRLLLVHYSPRVEVIDMLKRLRNSLWDLATCADAPPPQGYQGLQPRKFAVSWGSRSLGDLKEPEAVQGLTLVNSGGSMAPSVPAALLLDDGGGPRYARLCNLRTLVLDGLPSFPADDFFSKMDCLRVLLISKAKVSSLPTSLFSLPNLRMLLLRACKSLAAFSVPGAHTCRALHGLGVLDLSWSAICDFPDQAFVHMRSLEQLRLRGCSRLNIVADNLPYFKNMQTLRVLDLSKNKLIELLPEQLIIAAPNLKRLLLPDCPRLKTLTPHLYSHSALEELDLRSCPALQEEEIEFKMPMLKLIHLSGSPAIRRLSFRGCSKLEVAELYELRNLESLDLSGTAIKELNPGIFRQPNLTSLVFVGATNLRTFPWKEMEHPPEELLLDQHMVEPSNRIEDVDLTQRRQSFVGGSGVWIHVRDGRFFRMLCDPEKGTYSTLESSFTQRFYIKIAPSMKRGKREDDIGELARRFPRQYRGIRVQPKILPKQSPLCRHVDIQKSLASPRDIHGFLKNTLSLSVSDQHTYRSLSELTPMGSVVKQCQIEKCHGMEAIFESSADSSPVQSLESLWASELRTVVAFAVEKGRSFNWSQGFTNLKHIHLEFCPRLRYVFPPGAREGLQSLEILEIILCPNLKEVFASSSLQSHQATASSSSPTLPFAARLRIVHLLQLPSLVSICHEADTHWPTLERFKVRGCWRLTKLPFLAYNESTTVAAATSSSALPTPRVVTIDGEPVWWKNVLPAGTATAKYEFQFTGIDVPVPLPKK